MATIVKSKHYLQDTPTETFRLRFKKKYASRIVSKLMDKMEEDERNLPDTIEQVMIEYFNLKPTKTKPNGRK